MALLLPKLMNLEAELCAGAVINPILIRLKTELPLDLTYHTAAHTREVIHDALVLASFADLSSREIELLGIAAAFHDAGFLVQREGNESIAASMAYAAMKATGMYSPDEGEVVQRMIVDTTFMAVGDGFSQIPRHPLSRFLLDADLSDLGKGDFLEKLERFRSELGQAQSKLFYEKALSLMSAHAWQTVSAKKLRSKKWRENRDELALRVAAL